MAKIQPFEVSPLSNEFAARERMPDLTEGTSALGSTIGGIGEDFNKLALSESNIATELDRQRQKADTAQAAIDNENRKIDVASKADIGSTIMNGMYNQAAQKNFMNTDTMVKDIDGPMLDYQKQAISDEPDPQKKLMLEGKLDSVRNSYLQKAQNFVTERANPIAVKNNNIIAGNLSMTLNNADLPPQEVVAKVTQFKQDNNAGFNLHGMDVNEAGSKAVEGYVTRMATAHPDQIDSLANNKPLMDQIEPQKVASLFAQVRETASRQQAENERDTKTQQLSNHMALNQQLSNASPDGRPGNAPAAVYNAAISKYKPTDLSPQSWAELNEQKNIGAKKQINEVDENTALGQLGTLHANNDSLAAKIETLYGGLKNISDTDDENHTKTHAAMNALQSLVSKYNDGFVNMNSIAQSVTSKEGREWVQSHVKDQTSSRFSAISQLLSKDPQASQVRANRDEIFSKLPTPNVYADPKKQATFKFFWDSAVNKRIMHGNVTTLKMIKNNPAYREALMNNIIKREAVTNTEAVGWQK